MSDEGIDMMPEDDGLLSNEHVHICSICEHEYHCQIEDCDETDDTAICEDCLEYDDSDDVMPNGEDYE